MKKSFSKWLLIGMLAVGSVACSDKDKEPGGNPDKPDMGSGDMEQMTPTESKKFLSDAANDFLSKFKAGDQRSLIELCSYFSDRYGDLEMPESWDVEATETVTPVTPKDLLKGLEKAMASGNSSTAGAVIISYVYSIDWEQFKGIYKPGINHWVKAGESNDIIFQFNDMDNAPCELKATASSKNSEGQITWADDYYSYEYEGIATEENTVNYKIPQEITVTLKQNNNTLVDSKVKSDIDVSGHKFNVNANTLAANIRTIVDLQGTDTKITQSSSLQVSGETLLTSTAAINGYRLCDFDYYKELADKGNTEDALVALLQNGNATVNVMNKVSIDATGSYSKDLYEALEGDFDSRNYNGSLIDTEKAVTKALNVLNNNLTALVRFNNTKTVQAKMLWSSTYEDYNGYYGDYRTYYIEPLIQFEQDKTTYSFEGYFERGFSSVEETWADLQESYEKVWNSIASK